MIGAGNQAATFSQQFVVEDHASAEFRRMQHEAEATSRTFAKAGMALGALFAVDRAQAFVSSMGQTFREVKNLATQMGTTGSVAEAMRNQFEDAGVGLDALNAGMARWSTSVLALRQAKPGEALSAELQAWKGLGPDAMQSVPEAFARIAREVEGARTETEKLNVAARYFGGEMAAKMLPVLNQGEDALRRVAEASGGPFSKENMGQFNEFSRKMNQANREFSRLGQEAFVRLMPALTTLAESAMPAIETAAKGTAAVMGVIADHAGLFAAAVKSAAVYWATMKLAAGASTLGTAAGGVLARLGVGAGAAASAGAAGLMLPSAAAAMAAPRAFRVGAMGEQIFTESAAAHAARANAGLLGQQAAAGGLRGAGAMSGLMGLGKGVLKALPGIGIAATLAEGLYDAYGPTKELGSSMTQAAARMQELRAQHEHTRALKAEAQALQTTEEIQRRFTEATGLSVDKMKELGFTVDDLAGAVRQGARALSTLSLLARGADQRDRVKQLKEELNAQVAEKVWGPEVSRLRKQGKSWKSIRRELTQDDAAEYDRRMKEAARVFQMDKDDISHYENGRPVYGTASAEAKMEGFSKEFRAANKDLADRLAEKSYVAYKAEAEETQRTIAAGSRTVNNFNGPINIRQEFRDQNPDRIIIGMLEEIERLAEHPVTSRHTNPFGAR